MIAECMIFLASVLPMGFDESKAINQYISCDDHVPKSMQPYAKLYVEHFDKENIDIAVRIGWCESRGKSNAYRNDNGDTGVMQFVSWTWNWVAAEYNLPIWDEWIILRWGRPYDFKGKTYKTNYGFEQIQVQFSPYYNILMASILAEVIYGKTQWRDWSSSAWCWGDKKLWELRWKKESSY